jgi:RimJ/RimL family protein N-acetyltransferase
MFPTTYTQRLIIRPLQASDLHAFHAYRNDPEVARYQSWEWISEEGARRFIEECIRSQPGIPGQWYQVAIELRETGGLIGDMGLGVDLADPGQGEVGYTLAREHWGQGYGSEAVAALLDYAFSSLGMARINAMCDTRNTASARLMEKVGMTRVGISRDVLFKGEFCDEYRYSIDRDEWERLRSTESSPQTIDHRRQQHDGREYAGRSPVDDER